MFLIVVTFAAYLTFAVCLGLAGSVFSARFGQAQVAFSLYRAVHRFREGRLRDGLAFLFALVSTCALPWSGVSLFSLVGVPSWLWFPAAGISLLLLPVREGAWATRFVLILSAMCAIGALSWYMLKTGVPGNLPDLESLSLVLRLDSIRNERLIAAMLLFAFSLLLGYAPFVAKRDFSSAMLSFSLSGFLVVSFIPLSAGRLFHLAPPQAIAADVFSLLVVALLLQHIALPVFHRITSLPIRKSAFLLTPLYFSLAGCYFLLTG